LVESGTVFSPVNLVVDESGDPKKSGNMDIDGKQSVFVSGKSELLSNGGITMCWTNFGENI
jgi:hypothetical protein